MNRFHGFTPIQESGGVPMKRKRAIRLFLFGMPVAFFGFILLGLATLGCSCMPTIYEEVPLSQVPDSILQNAIARMPGYTPSRAWLCTIMREKSPYGYRIRGKTGYFSTKDVKIDIVRPTEPSSPELEPIESKP